MACALAAAARANPDPPPAAVTAPVEAAEEPAAPGAVRVTSSFDVKYAGAVLRQVAKLMHAGFVRRDAEAVAHEIDQLPAEQSRQWEFVATYKRVGYPLQIRARLDDFGMLDLDFFCAQPVAGAVRGAVDGYLNSRGL
ncbi:MAG TPA: hypothetical protein VGL28_08975 [Steroidobacteraceae bacterium]